MPEPSAPFIKSHPEYIYGIDLIRFACAFGVAAFHLTWKTPETAWWMPVGWVGVQVFFVISGLVIANSAHGATPRQFLTSRFLRLYPAAWCAAAISFPLLVWQFPKMGDRLERRGARRNGSDSCRQARRARPKTRRESGLSRRPPWTSRSQ